MSSIHNRFLEQSPSLYREFFLFISASLAIVLTITFIGIWRACVTHAETSTASLENSARLLEKTLYHSLEYTDFMLRDLAKQIGTDHHWETLEMINRLFASFRLNHANSASLSWGMLSWLNVNGNIAAGDHQDARQYATELTSIYPILRSKNEQHVMHIGKPFVKPDSHEKTLPIAIGVTRQKVPNQKVAPNQKVEYVGSILLGFSLDRLSAQLSSIPIDPAISFALLDRQGEILFASSTATIDLMTKQLSEIQLKIEKADKNFYIKDGPFFMHHYYMQDLEQYPYRIIALYSPSQDFQQLLQATMQKLLELILVSLLILTLFFIVKRRIIRPIRGLSVVAKHIAQGWAGKTPVTPSQHQEINLLAYYIEHMSEAMKRLKHTQQELVNKSHEAKSSDRAKSEFLACVSHELRTPLNAIIGYAEMIHTQVVGPIANPHYLEYASIIQNSGQNLLQTISDILDIANAESGVMWINLDVVDLKKAITEILETLEPLFKHKELELTLSLPADLPLVQGDPLRLKQVIYNLVTNAIKFSNPGETIDIYAYIHPSTPRPEVKLHINDAGIGIAAEKIEHVMNPFSQADSGITRNYDGIGLGLPIAKKLVALQGGVLEIASPEERGTQVTITLLTAVTPAPPAAS